MIVEVPLWLILAVFGAVLVLSVLTGMAAAAWWTERTRSTDLMYLTGLQAPSRDLPEQAKADVKKAVPPEQEALREAERAQVVEGLRVMARREGIEVPPEELEEEADRLLNEVDRRMS